MDLLDLPWEMLELVVSFLPPSSCLALSSSSSHFLLMLGQTRVWRGVVKRSRVEGLEEVQHLASLLRRVVEPTLLSSLLPRVVEEVHPCTEEERVVVVHPSLPPATTTLVGLLLVRLTKVQGWHVEELVYTRGSLGAPLLPLLGSLEVRGRVDIWGLEVRGGKEGEAVVELLRHSSTWRVMALFLEGVVGRGLWRGLAAVAGRGRVAVVHTSREQVAEGVPEEVAEVWGATERGWTLREVEGVVTVWKEEEVEGQGWLRLCQGVEELMARREQEQEDKDIQEFLRFVRRSQRARRRRRGVVERYKGRLLRRKL